MEQKESLRAALLLEQAALCPLRVLPLLAPPPLVRKYTTTWSTPARGTSVVTRRPSACELTGVLYMRKMCQHQKDAAGSISIISEKHEQLGTGTCRAVLNCWSSSLVVTCHCIATCSADLSADG
jgi:hypothetical protein